MKRRDALRSLFVVPAAAALPASAVAEQSQASAANRENPTTATVGPDAAAETVARTFSVPQLAALRKLGELILPAAQGLPGTTEAGAADFLDFLIGASPADRLTLYREGLDRLNAEAERLHHKPFAGLEAAQAGPILAPLKAPWSYAGPSDSFARFLLTAKSDLITATVNSQEYIAAVSERRRSAGGVSRYWYPVE